MRPVIPAILVVALSAAGSAKRRLPATFSITLPQSKTNAGKVLSFIHGWCQPAFLPLFTVLRGCWMNLAGLLLTRSAAKPCGMKKMPAGSAP